MKNFKNISILSIFLCTSLGNAQEILSVTKAIEIAVSNNYDLRISKNNVERALIETELLNTGYLPRITASGGINYSNENQSTTFSSGETTTLDGAETESYNASLIAEYTIFDGLERKFINLKNEETLLLRELQDRQQIENTIITIYETYYNVAFQQQVVNNLQINIENSEDRLVRAQKKLTYGQGTKLDALNAEVDLNTDRINLASTKSELASLKRTLNLVLGRDIQTAFEIDTTVIFTEDYQVASILEKASKNNIQHILARQNILLSELDIRINKASFLPKITGSGSYNWNQSQNPATSFALDNEASGVSLGLNMSWNIFDGGRSKTLVKTAKIDKKNREIELYQAQEQLKTDIYNAFENYTNQQYTRIAEEKNVDTNLLNFNRTKQQYSLGQITTVEYRQAQINLLNAQNNYTRATYDLKIAEINLQQLAGNLID